MRLIDADHLLEEIAKLKESPWFNEGKLKMEPMAYSPHVLYATRKEAIGIIEDLCIRREPIVKRPKVKREFYTEELCICPVCSAGISSKDNYCSNCGAEMEV